MKWHPNTMKLISIEDKAIKLGWYAENPGKCFSEEVARRSGEMGNEYPSLSAIAIALRMLRRLEEETSK